MGTCNSGAEHEPRHSELQLSSPSEPPALPLDLNRDLNLDLGEAARFDTRSKDLTPKFACKSVDPCTQKLRKKSQTKVHSVMSFCCEYFEF
jgi:hypothetical protein